MDVGKRNIKRWAGHVVRMDEERQTRKAMTGRMNGRRPRGRPIRRWVGRVKGRCDGELTATRVDEWRLLKIEKYGGGAFGGPGSRSSPRSTEVSK